MLKDCREKSSLYNKPLLFHICILERKILASGKLFAFFERCSSLPRFAWFEQI